MVIWSSSAGHETCVTLVVEHGADVNLQNDNVYLIDLLLLTNKALLLQTHTIIIYRMKIVHECGQ